MVLPASGAISFSTLKAEFGFPSSNFSLGFINGWCGTYVATGEVSVSKFYGKSNPTETYEYPPTSIPFSSNWTRPAEYFNTNRVQNTTLSGAAYGSGFYKAYANIRWWNYSDSTTLAAGESAPAGALDKGTTGQTTDLYVTSAANKIYTSSNVANPPVTVYFEFPFGITVRSYSIRSRANCCAVQSPTYWNLEGSSNLIDWDTVQTVTIDPVASPWTLGMLRSYAISGVRRYQYWRINMYSNGSLTNEHMALGTIIFYATEYRN